MNDLQAHPGLPSAPDNMLPPAGRWHRTVAFLKRDLRTFFPGDDAETVPQPSSEVEPSLAADILALPPVEPLVDSSKLPDLALRREVLDWRDDFHAEMTSAVAGLQDAFIQLIDAELARANLLRKVLPRAAHEVLQDGFVRIVRLPLIAALRQQEATLNAMAGRWALFGQVDLAFDVRTLEAECASLADLGFKHSNRALMLARVEALMLGTGSVAEQFREQGRELCRKLLEARGSR